jgi:hypothetical protein
VSQAHRQKLSGDDDTIQKAWFPRLAEPYKHIKDSGQRQAMGGFSWNSSCSESAPFASPQLVLSTAVHAFASPQLCPLDRSPRLLRTQWRDLRIGLLWTPQPPREDHPAKYTSKSLRIIALQLFSAKTTQNSRVKPPDV